MKPYIPDQTDLGILKLLQKDAHITYKELATRLHKSQTPIRERIERLEKLGYIRAYVALLDYRKLPDCMIAYLQVQIREHSMDALNEFQIGVCQFSEVVECSQTTGAFDFILKIVCRNMHAYNDFLTQKLAGLNNVGTLNSSVVIKQSKNETALPL